MDATEADLNTLCELLDEDDEEPSEAEAPSEADALRKQMLEMQEQMKMMQEKLEKAEKKSLNASNTSMPSPSTAEESFERSNRHSLTEGAAEKVAKLPSKPKSPCRDIETDRAHVEPSQKCNRNQKTLTDSDFLVNDGASEKAPKSPPKPNNPFKEVKTSGRTARMYVDPNKHGPGLPKKSAERRITGEEKRRLMASIKTKDVERKEQLAMVAKDLEDSSDEEAERNPMEQKYNAYGLQIRRQMKQQPSFENIRGSHLNLSNQSANKPIKNLMLETHSKLRIVNPLVDQTAFNLSLVGRKMIPIHRLKNAITFKETEGNWATVGAIFYKSTQTSKNGNKYTLWRMTDLQGDLKTVSVLLFAKANAQHYSMPLNKVVGILNPKVLDDRSGKGEVSLSIDHPDKVLEMGDSVDVGKCQGKRQDGTGCTALVNKNQCEYCSYHVKRAYKNMSSKRSDLQSSFSGNSDIRDRIMSKIAPKGKFYCSTGFQMFSVNFLVALKLDILSIQNNILFSHR